MKSLLVDALRAANESGSSATSEPEALAVAVEEAVPAEHTTSTSEPDKPPLKPDVPLELELQEPQGDAEFAESVVIPPDAEFLPANDQSNRQDGTRVLDTASELADKSARVSGGAAGFERLAVWTPLVCLFLGAVATASFSGWTLVTGDEHSVGLRALASQGNANGSRQGTALDSAVVNRFEFRQRWTPRTAAPVPMPTSDNARTASQPAAAAISIERNTTDRRQTGKLTAIDGDSFSSLESALGAYLAGEVSRSYISQLLASRVQRNPAASETDIKLLLQRHPEAAPLHYALGTLLQESARYPEAGLSFARASELDAGSAGETSR
jgi:hypothetical protein